MLGQVARGAPGNSSDKHKTNHHGNCKDTNNNSNKNINKILTTRINRSNNILTTIINHSNKILATIINNSNKILATIINNSNNTQKKQYNCNGTMENHKSHNTSNNRKRQTHTHTFHSQQSTPARSSCIDAAWKVPTRVAEGSMGKNTT